ncbi:hypothetical protein DL95DRAFT_485843 [Leptodontidium sp. 2 PMI_412]|nr:hypothetical protein DL95DRAFT_485843 [Leptodontidium sp. 2 PMI_412]
MPALPGRAQSYWPESPHQKGSIRLWGQSQKLVQYVCFRGGTSNATSDVNYCSFRGYQETQTLIINPSSALSQGEPMRYSVHLVPVDSAQYARSVREDTVELASYALSNKVSTKSASPPQRQRSTHAHLESYFPQDVDSESASNREGLRHDIIQEALEHVCPESRPPNKPHSTSIITNKLSRSLLSTSPPIGEEGDDIKHSPDRKGDVVDSGPRRLIITSSGVGIDTSERTLLLGEDATFETHHANWIRGQQDIEGREIKRRPS